MIRPRTKKNGKKTYTVRVGDSPARSFDRWQDADDYETLLKRNRKRARAGLDVDKGAITYDALCELYLAQYTGRSGGWTENMLGYSRDKWGKLYVRQLEPEMIAVWLQTLTGHNGKPLAPKTRHHILERMRTVCSLGVEWGYLSKSPVRPRAVKSPGQQRVRPIRPLESWEEVTALADVLSAMYPPWGCLVRFVCATGLRPGEWSRLRWRMVDLEHNEVAVPGEKNDNAMRTIVLPAAARTALAELPTTLFGHQPVFTTKRGKPLTTHNYHHWRKTAWKVALTMAGLEDRDPYEMRHTFATLALQSGVPLEIVAKLMGHGSVEITRTYYAKWTRATLHRYSDLLDQIGAVHERLDENAAPASG